MKPYSRALPGALALVALFGVAGCSRNGAPPSEPGTATDAATSTEGTPTLALLKEPMDVPAFTVTDLDGKTIAFADLRGKVVLVNYWATWCPPCRAEIPDLVKLQEKYRDKLVVIGVSEDEDASPQEVKAFGVEQKMNYPIVMATPELSKIFKGVTALPTTFVIDPEGKIRQRHVGMLRADTTELETRYLSGMMKNVKVDLVEDETTALLANAAQAKEIPGVDLTKMTPAQRTAAIKAMNSENCTCGCELTLAACRINDPSCSVSLPLAQKLAERIAKGETTTPSSTH
ncbi:MAG TPA: TlpA disulfide reductase family protein [Vicinamibacterales bacterium]|nr:TlpA disulfide reductase family protein [Vicinamibacterales bacterium]